MTDEVAAHVLAHNYDQTLRSRLLEAERRGGSGRPGRFMAELEARGRLDRAAGRPARRRRPSPRAPGRQGPDAAGTGGAARLWQAGAVRRDHRLGGARTIRLLRGDAEGLFPQGRWRGSTTRCTATGCGGRSSPPCSTTTSSISAARPSRPPARGRRLRHAPAWWPPSRRPGRCCASTRPGRGSRRSTARSPPPPRRPSSANWRDVLRGQTYWLARRARARRSQRSGLIGPTGRRSTRSSDLVPAVLSPFEQKAAVRRAAGLDQGRRAQGPRPFGRADAAPDPRGQSFGPRRTPTAGRWRDAAHVYHRVGGAFGFDRLRAAAGAIPRPTPTSAWPCAG